MKTFKCIWCEETKDIKYKHTCERCKEEEILGFADAVTDVICIECDNKSFTDLISGLVKEKENK
jgi:hypothetical protein